MFKTLLLLVTNAALVTALVDVAIRPVEDIEPPANGRLQISRNAPADSPPEPRSPVDLAHGGEAFARPLFAPDRRPWLPEPEPVYEEPEPEPEPEYVADEDFGADVLVIGIGIARGRARALLVSSDGDELGWVSVGDSVLDWTVAAISERGVTVERADNRIALELHSDALLD